MIKYLFVALCCIYGVANADPNQAGIRWFGAVDSDGNKMNRTSLDGWIHNRTSNKTIIDTKWNSFYLSNDMNTSLINNQIIPNVVSNPGSRSGAFIKLDQSVDITDGVMIVRVKVSDWNQIKEFSLILSSDGTNFENTITADMTTLVKNKINDQWISVVVPVHQLERYQNPDITKINAVMWKVTDRGRQVVTEVDGFSVIRDDHVIVNSIIPPPEMIRERDRQDWGIGINQTNYVTDKNNRYNGQGLVMLANYNSGPFSLVGELGVGQLNNGPKKNFLLGDMTATVRINKNLSLYGGVYGDVVASDTGLADSATFTGFSIGTELSHDDVGGISFAGYQQNYSNNNIQEGFLAKAYLNTPIDGINVYVSTKQYVNSLPYNGLFYSPENYSRYNIGIGFRQPLGSEWTLSGHVDIGQALADGEWSNVNSFRISLDKTLVKNFTFGIAVGSDINPGNNYRYQYGQLVLRYTF